MGVTEGAATLSLISFPLGGMVEHATASVGCSHLSRGVTGGHSHVSVSS